ncbi:MAG: GHKL domain-containing protein, partial [Hyphomonadaceae bacterium]|nr:GHKL domain-containing protein [Clostridia bacterium]
MNTEMLVRQEFLDEQQLDEQNIRNLQMMNSILRKEKHDIANHLQVILAQCLHKKATALEDIADYLHEIVDRFSRQVTFFDTGNSFLDGLLSIKSNRAFENNITFEVNFEQPVSRLSINTADLISILGNLIDNSFEAITAACHTNGVTSVLSYVENNVYHLSVSNTGTHIPPQLIDKIFVEGFSTKTGGYKRGYGLAIVKHLVQKNGGSK